LVTHYQAFGFASKTVGEPILREMRMSSVMI